MMKKLKWIAIIAVIAGAVDLFYSLITDMRDRVDEAKKQNYERAETDRELLGRIEQIQIQSIDLFDATSLRQVINFLVLRLGESDPPSPFLVMLSEWKESLSAEFLEKKVGKLRVKNVSVAELFDVALMRVGKKWKIVGGRIAFENLEHEGNNEVHAKLDRIKLEILEFTEDTTVRQAINFMRLRARELDDEIAVEKRGLGFVFQDDAEGMLEQDASFGDTDKIENREIGGFCLYKVSLREALTVICRRGGIKWHVGEYKIVFSRR